MSRLFPRIVLAAVVLPIATLAIDASTPRFWKVSTQADLLKGEVEQLSIDEIGRLVPGPLVKTVHDASVPFIWCLAAGADGSVYAGTGNDGQVLRVTREGRASVWFDAPELEVHALAVAPDGALYAATSPAGRVYRIDPSGSSRVMFDPDEKYIWSLALDARGRLLVGTGEKGTIYRVGADGRAETIYASTSAHVTALAFDAQGRVLAGTGSPARIVRIENDGRPFVLLDSPYRELRAVRADAAGRIYAAAVNGKQEPEATAPAQPAPAPRSLGGVPSVSTEITAIAVMDIPTIGTAAAAAPHRESPATAKGALYRIDADGRAETIWESPEDIPYDVMLDGPDTAFVSTGPSGKIYRVGGNPARAALVTRVSGKQTTSMLAVGPLVYAATSNPARVVTVSRAPAPEGTYVSDVRDAGTVAAWGTLSWRAATGSGGRAEVYTRSGNTATPDDTWSPWAGPYRKADGEAVQSPAARYLQWKVVLAAGPAGAPGPALASLSVAYLQRNQRPRVTDITVHPPGVVFQRPFPTGEPEIAGLDGARPEQRVPVYSLPLGLPSFGPGSLPALGRRLYQKALQAFVWRAEDDNDDRLIYDASVRRVEDAAWTAIRTDMLDGILVWDTTSAPDGSYVLRVRASDRLSNPPAAALVGESESAAFDVDNTPPGIAVSDIRVAGATTRVTFEVRDTYSAIDRVEYSVDAGPWQAAYPADGAADGTLEHYEIVMEGQAAGRTVIRATDAMNNTGTARVGAAAPSPGSPVRK